MENAIILPICRPAKVSLPPSFFLEHVYGEVVVIVAHIFPWFYTQEWLKRPYRSGIGFPSSFLKNWQTWSFLVRFPRLYRAYSLWKWGHKSWIARYTSSLGCVSRVNKRLSKDSLLKPSLMNCILSSWFIDSIPKERHCALQVHLAHLWQIFNYFARHFFAKMLLPVPGICKTKELEDSYDKQTFASIISNLETW